MTGIGRFFRLFAFGCLVLLWATPALANGVELTLVDGAGASYTTMYSDAGQKYETGTIGALGAAFGTWGSNMELRVGLSSAVTTSTDANDGGYTTYSAPSDPSTEDGGRELTYGMGADIYTNTDLQVTRKVYVPSGGNFVRYVDSFYNTTASPITVDINIRAQYNALSGVEMYATSSGDTTLTGADHWGVFRDTGDTTPDYTQLACIWDASATVQDKADAAGVGDYDYFAWAWESVTIPAYTTYSYMYFAVLQSTAAAPKSRPKPYITRPTSICTLP